MSDVSCEEVGTGNGYRIRVDEGGVTRYYKREAATALRDALSAVLGQRSEEATVAERAHQLELEVARLRAALALHNPNCLAIDSDHPCACVI